MNSDPLMTMVRALEEKYEQNLTSSDTAESLAQRWQAELQSWRIAYTYDPKHDPISGRLDMLLTFSGPPELVRSAFPEWERNTSRGAHFKIGSYSVFVAGDQQLHAMFESHGTSTEEFERKVNSFLAVVDQGEAIMNKAIESQNARSVARFERAIIRKEEENKQNEAELARLGQVADVAGVLSRLKNKKKS